MLTLFSTLPVMDRVFDDVMRGTLTFDATPQSGLDVHVDEERLTLQIDVPGVKMEDLSVEVEGSVLRIKGERTNGKKTYLNRAFAIPKDMNPETLTATLDHGVLTVEVHKHQSAKPRKIEILRSGTPPAKQIETT